MKPEDLLKDEFLKLFRSRETLNNFLRQLQKRGIEKMLEGELDDHLGYDRHEQSSYNNYRNGYGKRVLRPAMVNPKYGCPETVTQVLIAPATRSMIVPKRENMVDGIEEVILTYY